MNRSIATLVLLSLPSIAAADTLHVPAEYTSIQAAINVADDGDVVLVDQGLYVESLDFLGKAITVAGPTSAVATLLGVPGGDSVVRFVSGEGQHSVLRNFSLSNGAGRLVETAPGVFRRLGGAVYIDGAEPSIINCRFHDNAAELGGAIYVADADNARVANCRFTSNAADDGGAIFLDDAATALVSNCIFSANTADRGGAVCLARGSGVRVVNATMHGNAAPGGGGALFNDSECCGGETGTSVLLANSIVWGNSPDEVVDQPGSGTTIRHCNVMGGWFGAGSGNMTTNPLLLNAAGGNFGLGYASLCIDAGDDDEVLFDQLDLDEDGILDEAISIDLNGDPRFRNAAVDIGAVESDYCPADFTGDRKVNVVDWLRLLLSLGTCTAPCSRDLDNNNWVGLMEILEVINAWGACEFFCPSDINADGVVDVGDLLIMLGAWGPCQEAVPFDKSRSIDENRQALEAWTGPECIAADFDGSGEVDVADLLRLLGAWGPCQ